MEDYTINAIHAMLSTEKNNVAMAELQLEFYASKETLNDIESADKEFWSNNLTRAEEKIVWLNSRISELESVVE